LIVHDVYPDVAVALEAIPDGGVIERTAGAASRWLYERSPRSWPVERHGRENRPSLSGRRGQDRRYPPRADIDDIRPSDSARKTFLGELGLDDRFVVQYAGNIGRTHGSRRSSRPPLD